MCNSHTFGGSICLQEVVSGAHVYMYKCVRMCTQVWVTQVTPGRCALTGEGVRHKEFCRRQSRDHVLTGWQMLAQLQWIWACQQTPLSRQHLSPCRSKTLEQNVEVSSCLLHGGDNMGWATVFPQLRAVLFLWPLENSLFSSFTCLAFRCTFSDLFIQPLLIHAPHRDAQR